MPPHLIVHTSVLARSIRNIEQAQGLTRRRATVADIFQTQTRESAGFTQLPLMSAIMDGNAGSPDNPADLSSPPDNHTHTHSTADLTASTALLANLRTRNSILAADLARSSEHLDAYERKAANAPSKVSRSKAKWKFTAGCLLVVWATYLWWCWYMSVEFEYIRKRRRDVFGV